MLTQLKDIMQFFPTSIFHGGLTRYLPILIVDRRFFHFWRNHSYQFQLVDFPLSSSSANLGKVPRTVFFPICPHPEVLNLFMEQEKCKVPFVNHLELINNPFKTRISTGVSAIKRKKQTRGNWKCTELSFSSHSSILS